MAMRRLPTTSYLKFPFSMAGGVCRSSDRRDHVREQIAQVLLTVPGERLFRPEFGAGVRRLVFEPNAPAVWELTRKRLMASLIEALQGEVDPRTLEVEVGAMQDGADPGPETLLIQVRYQLAALGEREEQVFTIGPGSIAHG